MKIRKLIFLKYFKIYRVLLLANPEGFLAKQDFKNEAKNTENAKEDSIDPKKSRILCGICSNHITHKSEKIRISQEENHTFVNPHGFIYNVECYKSAPGCSAIGRSTDEFTWFKGYSWQIIICNKCQTHLGWKYKTEGSGFFGLISDLIIEKDEG